MMHMAVLFTNKHNDDCENIRHCHLLTKFGNCSKSLIDVEFLNTWGGIPVRGQGIKDIEKQVDVEA